MNVVQYPIIGQHDGPIKIGFLFTLRHILVPILQKEFSHFEPANSEDVKIEVGLGIKFTMEELQGS